MQMPRARLRLVVERRRILRLAEQPASRGRGCRLVRGEYLRGGKGRRAPAEQSRVRPRGLCSARLLSWPSGLARERLGNRQGTVPVLLGRQQDRIVVDRPALQIRRGDRPADSTVSPTRVHRTSPLLARQEPGGRCYFGT